MTPRRRRVAIVGASGLIGQHFARLLATHPWFDEPLLVGSERTAGRRLEEVWRLPVPIPRNLASLRLRTASPRELVAAGVDIAFGALPSGTAAPIETEIARRGIAVFTNSADLRRERGVPLLVPEVNPSSLAELKRRPRGRAPIVANPNCTATGLALAMAPVWAMLRPSIVHVATYQALSGAGVPGVGALGVADNVLPFIDGEEEKVGYEASRLLGASARSKRGEVPFLVNAARVPVTDGHLEAVTVTARGHPALGDLERAWAEFDPLAGTELPTAPHPPVQVRPEVDRPQPALDRWTGEPPRARGMVAVVGRVRWEPPYLRLFVLSHNTVRGGAGGSVLNAEFAIAQGLLDGGRAG